MLCNMIYQGPRKDTNWHDYIIVIYRDLVTDKKEIMTIEDPEINIYAVKPEYRRFKKPRHFMHKKYLDEITIKYKNVYKEIAKIGGPSYLDFYNSHTMSERKSLLKYPYVLGADVNIETYYRVLWDKQCKTEGTKPLTKAYWDIEVDQIDFTGNIARNGECPINAISFVDASSKTVYEFLLDNHNNPLIKEFKENIQQFYNELHECFDEFYGKFEYKIFMFDDEQELLIQFYNLVHTLKRDFLEGWNIFGFDINYIICRLRELGFDPTDIICDDDFPVKHLYFHEDTKSFEFANKRSYFKVNSKSYYIDMMLNYAGLRKSQGAVKRVNLGYIAKKELKDSKLDYSDSGNIRTLPYNDYRKFVLYSIKDSLLLYGIDNKVHDTENLYLTVETNCVPYKDAMKQTVVFRSLMYKHLDELGYALGHNANFGNDTGGKYDQNGELINQDDDEDDTFEGAINGDPMLNEANGKMLYGIPSMFLYGLTIDFDFSAMYPNSILAFNIFATTMIGKVIIDYIPDITYDIDMGKEYIEDVIADDVLHIGSKWHNLSNTETLNAKMLAKLNSKRAIRNVG